MGREEGRSTVGDTGEVAHTVILLRHSKSDWSGDHADIDRPLTKRGRRQAAEAGQWLATHVDAIDLAVVSTAERARATWELAASELTERPRTRHEEDLYAASARQLIDVVRGLDEGVGTVVLVGHNPGLEDLTEALAGRSVRLPTSALAVIDLVGAWRDAGEVLGHLRAVGRPPTG
jgi:phosphohistidine phosphatase